MQVEGSGRLREPRVACRDGFCDGGVLAGGSRQPLCIVGGHAADPDQVHAQAAHGLGQIGIGDGCIDGGVEAACEFVVRVAARVAAVDQVRGLQKLNPQRFENGGVATFCGQRRSFSFEGFAQFEQFIDVIEGDVGDHHAAAARRRREAFCCEPAERLPERRARDPEAFGLLHLGQDRSGEKPPFDDVIAQRRISSVAGAHPVLLVRQRVPSVYTRRGTNGHISSVIPEMRLLMYTRVLCSRPSAH